MQVGCTYRLRVSKTARRELESEWDRARWVWNKCVERSRDCFKAGEECGLARLARELTGWRGEREWLAAGSCVPQQQVVRDFGAARVKALSDIKAKLPVSGRRGLPVFKKRSRAALSLNYTQRGFSVAGGRLQLAKGISVVVVWSGDLPSVPKSVRIHRDPTGAWWASFVVEVDVQELPATNKAIGVDWGVTETAVTTDPAFDVSHARHGKSAARKLARYQRQMARRRPPKGTPASGRYKAARAKAAKLQRHVARRRQDDRRKWAKALVRNFDRIAVEDFRPKFLAKSTMAPKAADAAIGAAKGDLAWMARKHGRDLRLVGPAYTTMDCGHCGARAKHRLPLSERTYACEDCGAVSPRDRNSAAVMVARAGFNPAGVDGVRLAAPPGQRAA